MFRFTQSKIMGFSYLLTHVSFYKTAEIFLTVSSNKLSCPEPGGKGQALCANYPKL